MKRLRKNEISNDSKKKDPKARKEFRRVGKWAAAAAAGLALMVAKPTLPVSVQTAQAQEATSKDEKKEEFPLRPTDLVSSEEPTPTMEPPQFVSETVPLASNSGDEFMQLSGANSNPIIDRLLGNQDLAKNVVWAIDNAAAKLYEHPNDEKVLRNASQILLETLNMIPEGREMWDSADFKEALGILTKCVNGNGPCDVRSVLMALDRDPTFNAVFDAMNNFFVATTNQWAVPVVHISGTGRFPNYYGIGKFEGFLSRAIAGCSWQILSFDLRVNYDWLRIGGEFKQLQLDFDDMGELSIREVGSMLIDQEGHLTTIRPELRLGTSAGGRPLEIDAFITLGYMRWKLGADVVWPGESPDTVAIRPPADGFYLGSYGFVFKFPGFDNENINPAIERIGIGAVGYEPHPHPFFYLTSSYRYGMSGNTEYYMFLSFPEYSYLLEKHRFGVELTPFAMLWQANKNVALQLSAGFKYVLSARESYKDYAGESVPVTLSHTFQPSARIGVLLNLWARKPVLIELRGGYVWEKGGVEGEKIPAWKGPGVPFGSLNVVVPLW